MARRHLLDFVLYTFPAYHVGKVHEFLAEHLEAFEQAVALLQSPRLMIYLHPRLGKSELVLRFMAYCLGRHPDWPVLYASYAANLAWDKSREARNIVTSEEYGRLFGPLSTQDGPVELDAESRAVDSWHIAKRKGGVQAAGVGGGFTGKGGRLIICDDVVKNWEEADSVVYRERVWRWYTTTLRTRAEPGAGIIFISCMTGDTPVLMADGSELPLRDVKVGDRVAIYDNGKLATSTVQNHKSDGLDSVFRIKTICGKIVCANERHPFLVEEHGQLKWIRLKHLTTGHRIVTLRGSGANGKERHASLTAAKNLLARGAIVLPTTAKGCGPMGIVPRPTMQSTHATSVSSGGTESPRLSTRRCLRRKTVSALSANSRQATTCARIGAESYALTTAMRRILSADYCATTVILPSDTLRQRLPHAPFPNTSDFITAQIESIEPAGVEEVFDIQIERTENFIANGLVSHNTRWHEDDLAGRLLKQMESNPEGDRWQVISLPALAGANDPLGRQPGEALDPARYDEKALAQIQASIPDRDWLSLYQQNPQPEGGIIFKREWFESHRYDITDRFIQETCIGRWLSFDTGYNDENTNAYTACSVGDLMPDYHLNTREVWRERLKFPDLIGAIRGLAERHNHDGKLRGVIIEDKATGTSAYQTLAAAADDWLARLLIPFQPQGSKERRAQQGAVWCRNGSVWLPQPDDHAPWLFEFEQELFRFPSTEFKDQVDSFSQLLLFLENLLAAGYRARGNTQ